MSDESELAPNHKDRSLGLVVFGAVAVLIGVVCALLVPLTLLAAAFSGSGGAAVDLRSALSASALYAVMAVAFVWLGIGSIRHRRWACELLLSLSWIWLLTGVCSMIIGLLVLPTVVRGIGMASELPPEMTSVVIVVVYGGIDFFFVVLPGLFVLFYRSPHVAATCRARHPEPQWIDECPRRLLTLTVVWVLAAISVLLMPAYDFIFPLFSVVLTGAAGAVLWALVLAVCVALAVGTCRGAPWAWWSGLAFTAAGASSSILVVLRHDLAEIVDLMNLPREQVSMIAALRLPDGWPMALVTALVWGTFFAYLMTLRRLFKSASPVADD